MAPLSLYPPLPVLTVLGHVIALVRRDARFSAALDAYAEHNPTSDNVAVRWLSRKEGYEVTLKLGASPLVAESAALLVEDDGEL